MTKRILISALLLCGLIVSGYSQMFVDHRIDYGNDSIVVHKVKVTKTEDYLEARYEPGTDSSQLAYTKHYVNGKLNGRCNFYFPNGQYHKTMIYGYGDLHGDYTEYDHHGNIRIKGKYRNDLKHGYWINKESQIYGRYRKGKRHSVWKQKLPTGKKKTWIYFDGTLKRGDEKEAEAIVL